MTTNENLSRIIEAVIKIDAGLLDTMIDNALQAGLDPLMIINEGVTVGLRQVGDLFAEEEIYLPELVQVLLT